MNKKQMKVYQLITERSFVPVSLTEIPGRKDVFIKAGMGEYTIKEDGEVIQTGPKTLCDGCVHEFTPKGVR